MIRTKFDDRFREIPLDINALKTARQSIEKDLPSALLALEDEPSQLDEIDYYRLLSRASDLERFELKYALALVGFEKTSKFWASIDWKKAAFLCDLKAALCRGYLDQLDASVEAFDSLLASLKKNEKLQIYQLFFYQFRGQVFAFHEDRNLAEADFRLALRISTEAGKRKQIERFRYFIEGLTAD